MKEIRKKIIKIVSIVLAAAMIGTSSGLIAFAVQSQSDTESSVSDSTTESYISEKSNSDSDGKEETVYIIANADGSTKKVIVSNWLKNGSKNSQLEDETTLSDIKNVKGEETFTNSGENYIWNADGSDIYYQGTTDKQLPVDMKITYTLDGKTVTPDEIKGKSGKVTMRFDYTNNEKRTVKVDGNSMEMYVPFLMVTGTVLDNSRFSNVKVTNGKLLNDGDRMAIIGFAMPGMQENLGLDKDDFEIPDYIEISADVKDFELITCMTVGTTELFNDVDTDKISMDDIDGTINEFTDAVNQLSDGSSQLYDGLVTLFEKSGELYDGTEQLVQGAAELKNGTGKLVSGANELASGADALNSGASQLKNGTGELVSGINELSGGADALNQGAIKLKDGTSSLVSGANDLINGADSLNSGAADLDTGAGQLENGAGSLSTGASQLTIGLKQLSSNSGALNDGAKQVFVTLLSTAEKQIKAAGIDVPTLTIKNYKTELNKIISSLDKDKIYDIAYNTALQKVTAEVNKNESTIKAGVEQAVKAKVLEAVLKASGYNMTTEQYSAAVSAGQISQSVQNQVNAAVEAQMDTDAVRMQISDKVTAQKQLLIEQNMSNEAVTAQINEAVASAKEGQKTIQELVAQLDAYNEFYTGLTSYTAGVDMAYSGSKDLSSGAAELYNGAKDLHSGTAQLKAGTEQLTSGGNTLISGVNQLDSGAGELKDGTGSLVDGVNKLSSGAGQLDSGAGELMDGTQSLVNGVGTLTTGTQQLDNGAGKLLDGANKLNDGVKTLIDGIKQLRDGSKELKDGMDEFNDKAVKKIVDAVDGDIAGLLDKLKATVAAGKDYDTFSGKPDTMNGSVKFIYRTEAISADD